MLFKLSPETPKFNVFEFLNAELAFFIKKMLLAQEFDRPLFSEGEIGAACWENAKTKGKFKNMFDVFNDVPEPACQTIKQWLNETIKQNQNLQDLFEAPKSDLLVFLPQECFEALKDLATHLYCSTKDLRPIILAAGNVDIKGHFNAFRQQNVNGNVCKACGMAKLAPFRAEVPDGEQWRADYDHQLCKSKYPIFAVHPDNLIPLCDVCNQDAKKAKDLFKCENNEDRLAFYPFIEEAKEFVSLQIVDLKDPAPKVFVEWLTDDEIELNKLETWNDVYDIKRRVEGEFRSLEEVIVDEISPVSLQHFIDSVNDKARPVGETTLKRKEWKFWQQKLFFALSQIEDVNLYPFFDKWKFVQAEAEDRADFILRKN